MARTIKNETDADYGIPVAQTSIEIYKHSVRYFLEYKAPFKSRLNQTTGFAVPDKWSRECQIEGAVKGATGIMAITHTTAFVPANEVAILGTMSGGFYAEEFTHDLTFDDWEKMSCTLRSDPECP